MTSYLISVVEEESVWRITPKEFVSALKRMWPDVVIISEGPNEVWFEAQPSQVHGYVYAYLQGSGDSVVVEMVDHLRDIVTIAIWFRSLVPESIPMQLFDEGYNAHVPVTTSSRVEDLAAVFRSADT